MGDCGKGYREVQEDQNTDVARIGSEEVVVGDRDEGSFCAMACPEGFHRAHGWTCADGSWAATALSRILLRKGRLEICR